MSEAASKTTVEIIPSVEGGLSAIASANAPFIFTDGTLSYGFESGVGNITLEAIRRVQIDGRQVSDRVVVAHLRFGILGLNNLRNALNALHLVASPAANDGTEPS